VYLLLYAIQSPFGAHFLKLDRLPSRADSVQRVVTAGADSLHPHRVHYNYDQFQCFDESQLPIDDEEGDIFVVPGLVVGEASVFTDCEPELFEDFTRLHPQDTRQTRARPAAPRLCLPADVREQLLQEYPWLTDEDLPGHVARRFGAGGRGTGGGGAGGGGHGGRPVGGHEAVPLPGDAAGGPEDLVLVDVAEQLAAFRADNAVDFAEDVFFFTRILGGRWTVEHRGVLADGIGGYARGGIPREWCDIYSWPKQHANYYGRYGLAGATLLASEYMRRSHYFIVLWLECEEEVFRYEQHHIDGYNESLEFVTWLCDQPVDSATFARGSDLRQLRPVNP
jgi:hypothetical protein